MKRYECHKTVEALKINLIHITGPDEVQLIAEDQSRVSVTRKWYSHHNPQLGGYFVRYKDGYESYSPAEAFEAGYTEIE